MKHYYHTPKWRLIRCWVAQGGVCAGCERPMPLIGKHVHFKVQPTEDHVIAKANGGRDDSTNVVAMHSYCNSKKGNTQPEPHVLNYLRMCQSDSRIIDNAAYAIAMTLHKGSPEKAGVPRNLDIMSWEG